jgi:hypothetical protein
MFKMSKLNSIFLVLSLVLFLEASLVVAQEINYFLIEFDGGVLAHPNTPEVSITRAQCRQRDRGIEMGVLGAAHTPANALVTIRDADSGTVFGSIAAVPGLDNPLIGQYNFDLGNDVNFLVCPDNIIATIPGGASAESGVDVRIDNAPIPPVTAVPFMIEAPVSAFTNNGDGTGSLVSAGILVQIPAGIPIHTPSTVLTINQLTDPTPLPGRFSPGFVGGTTIVEGTIENGVPIAEDLFIEPAENVVIGIITAANCTNSDCSNPGDSIELLGTPLRRITDPRMLAEVPKNGFGFEVDLSQGGLVGSTVAVEGYFGESVPSTRTSTVLNLNSGWNLLSIPIKPTNPVTGEPFTYTAESFGQLVNADAVSEWNSATQQYNTHVVGFPLNDFEISENKGFWAYVENPSSINVNGICLAGGV